MTLYGVFFLFNVSVILVARLIGLKNNIHIISFLAFLSAVMAGLRGNTGTDTFAYRAFYENLLSGDSFFSFEPVLSMLAILGGWLGLGSQFLIFSVALAQGVTIVLTARLLRDRDIYYLISVASFFVFLNLNLIRFGLSVYILGLSFLWMRQKSFFKARWGFVFSILTHFGSASLFFLFLKKWYHALLFLVLAFVFGGGYALDKVNSYFSSENIVITDFSIGVGFFATYSLFFLCLWRSLAHRERLSYLLFLGAFSMKALSFAVPIFDRFSIIFEYLLILFLLECGAWGRNRAIFSVLIVYGIYKSLAFLAGSDAAMELLIQDSPGMATLYGETRWLPFHFYWE